MDKKIKQRIVGVLIIVLLLLLLVPLLFSGSKKGVAPNIVNKERAIETSSIEHSVKLVNKPPPNNNNVIRSIQLASFSNKKNAETLIHKLYQKGVPGYLAKAKVNGGYLYRVIVGRNLSLQAANFLINELHDNFSLQGIVITKSQSKRRIEI